MASERFNLLPDPRLVEFKSVLMERLSRVAGAIRPANFQSLLDPMMKEVIREGIIRARADEGTVWLVDEEGKHLVPAYNTGPNAERMVGKFKQPLDSGLICMVFATEQPFVENEVFRNSRQSKLLDELLQVQTRALMAVPFYFQQGCRGVISCVQLGRDEGGVPSRFEPEQLAGLQRSAGVLSRLIELRLLSQIIGL